MADQALSDIRVLELGHSVAGPYCTRVLADYGAEVIKVEDPQGGDPTRSLGPFPGDIPDREKSGLFLHLNTNKQGITLNLASATGVKLVKELVRQVDLLVENHSPSFLPSLGLSYDVLAKENPRLVMSSISPFGQTGPYRDYKGTDAVIFALTSRMHLTGMPGREPQRYAPDVAWFQVGATAVVPTLGALFTSKWEGVGQWLDISAQECLMGNVDNRVLNYDYSGDKTGRGLQWPGYPSGAFPCADGYMVVMCGQDRFFRRLCVAIGREDLLQDPRWARPEDRVGHQEEFEEFLYEWLLPRTKREAFETLQAHRVMCAPLLGIDEVMVDPQMETRQYFVEVDHPRAGKLTQTGALFKMTETPWQISRPAPLLGEHNEEVYRGLLGRSAADLAQFRRMGVI